MVARSCMNPSICANISYVNFLFSDIIPRKIRAGDWLAKNRPRMKVTQVTKVQNEVINLDTDSNSGQSIIDLTDD